MTALDEHELELSTGDRIKLASRGTDEIDVTIRQADGTTATVQLTPAEAVDVGGLIKLGGLGIAIGKATRVLTRSMATQPPGDQPPTTTDLASSA